MIMDINNLGYFCMMCYGDCLWKSYWGI